MQYQKISKQELNEYSSSQKHAQFLQSPVWGEIREKQGISVCRRAVIKDGKIAAALQYFEIDLPLGLRYFYAPRISTESLRSGELDFLLQKIREEARRKGAVFFRFEPCSELSEKILANNIKRTADIQPSKTLVISLRQGEEDILKSMHQKTRYNIRLAAKKGVVVKKAGPERFNDFWELMLQTVDRDGFRPHREDYYLSILQNGHGMFSLYFAEHEGEVLASNLVAEFGAMAVYAHGASSNKRRNLMAPYLLQWEIIRSAKKNGCQYYDLYGIDEEKWPGVTRFKKGFGGQEIVYPGTFDMVLSPGKYYLYKALRKIRRMI